MYILYLYKFYWWNSKTLYVYRIYNFFLLITRHSIYMYTHPWALQPPPPPPLYHVQHRRSSYLLLSLVRLWYLFPTDSWRSRGYDESMTTNIEHQFSLSHVIPLVDIILNNERSGNLYICKEKKIVKTDVILLNINISKGFWTQLKRERFKVNKYTHFVIKFGDLV